MVTSGRIQTVDHILPAADNRRVWVQDRAAGMTYSLTWSLVRSVPFFKPSLVEIARRGADDKKWRWCHELSVRQAGGVFYYYLLNPEVLCMGRCWSSMSKEGMWLVCSFALLQWRDERRSDTPRPLKSSARDQTETVLVCVIMKWVICNVPNDGQRKPIPFWHRLWLFG